MKAVLKMIDETENGFDQWMFLCKMDRIVPSVGGRRGEESKEIKKGGFESLQYKYTRSQSCIADIRYCGEMDGLPQSERELNRDAISDLRFVGDCHLVVRCVC